jgi:hypothetical protein
MDIALSNVEIMVVDRWEKIERFAAEQDHDKISFNYSRS